jgi:hypothetical protein
MTYNSDIHVAKLMLIEEFWPQSIYTCEKPVNRVTMKITAAAKDFHCHPTCFSCLVLFKHIHNRLLQHHMTKLFTSFNKANLVKENLAGHRRRVTANTFFPPYSAVDNQLGL